MPAGANAGSGGSNPAGDADDYRHDVVQASVLLQSLSAHEDEGAAYFDWIAERAMSLVSMPRMVKAADALAEALIERRELTGVQASELIVATWKSMRSQLAPTLCSCRL